MLRCKIKIGSGELLDSLDEHGLVYLDSDKRVGAPARQFETVSYPERDGEDILPKSTLQPFDYKVKFFVQANSVDSANALLEAFNGQLYTTTTGTDVKTFLPVEFVNIYKRHKIVGYPTLIDLATDYWRDPSGSVSDIVVVEWTIRVSSPQDCDFNYSE